MRHLHDQHGGDATLFKPYASGRESGLGLGGSLTPEPQPVVPKGVGAVKRSLSAHPSNGITKQQSLQLTKQQSLRSMRLQPLPESASPPPLQPSPFISMTNWIPMAPAGKHPPAPLNRNMSLSQVNPVCQVGESRQLTEVCETGLPLPPMAVCAGGMVRNMQLGNEGRGRQGLSLRNDIPRCQP